MIASYHFAPTLLAKDNLLKEGKSEETIFVIGNTAIDALGLTVNKKYAHPMLEWASDSKLILLTAHRRENLGELLIHMFTAIRKVVDEHFDVKVIYPIHLNPRIREAASTIIGNHSRIKLIELLGVIDFHNFMVNVYLILTDSGGFRKRLHR